jgi:hypothetical protein
MVVLPAPDGEDRTNIRPLRVNCVGKLSFKMHLPSLGSKSVFSFINTDALNVQRANHKKNIMQNSVDIIRESQ